MRTVLITGANGFVGYYLSILLIDNYKVVATGKGLSRLSIAHPNYEYRSMDFTNVHALSIVFNDIQPDVVIHAGAISKPDVCELDQEFAYLSNVSSTQYLLEQAKLYKSYFLFISTDFVFDGQKGMYSEGDKPNPINYYGVTKYLAEQSVQNYSYNWAIVRTVLVYGHPGSGRDNILTIVAKNLKEGKISKIVDDQVRTPTYVNDLTIAIKTIIDKELQGLFHISGKDVLTPYQMTIAVARHLGLDETLITPVNANTFQQPALRPPVTGFTITKAERELNYHPVSFVDGLIKTFKDQ